MKEYIEIDNVICWYETRVPLTAQELVDREIDAAIQYFTDVTTQHIQAKIDEYNSLNRTAFANVHTCANYRSETLYTHQPFCAQVWSWNWRTWDAVRQFLSTATHIPTQEEFQAVLDGVAF